MLNAWHKRGFCFVDVAVSSSVSESFIFQFTRVFINRSVNTAPFGDFFRHMKPRPAQYAIFVFPAKGPLETKLCSFIFRKRVAVQTLNFAYAGFFIRALQSHKLLEKSERSILASSTTLISSH